MDVYEEVDFDAHPAADEAADQDFSLYDDLGEAGDAQANEKVSEAEFVQEKYLPDPQQQHQPQFQPQQAQEIASAASSFEPLPTQHSGSKQSSLIISNLTWWTTDQQLEDLLGEHGRVRLKSLQIMSEKTNGKSKGFAVAVFYTADEAAQARDRLQGCVVHGQPIVLNFGSAEQANRMRSTPLTPGVAPSVPPLGGAAGPLAVGAGVGGKIVPPPQPPMVPPPGRSAPGSFFPRPPMPMPPGRGRGVFMPRGRGGPPGMPPMPPMPPGMMPMPPLPPGAMPHMAVVPPGLPPHLAAAAAAAAGHHHHQQFMMLRPPMMPPGFGAALDPRLVAAQYAAAGAHVNPAFLRPPQADDYVQNGARSPPPSSRSPEQRTPPHEAYAPPTAASRSSRDRPRTPEPPSHDSYRSEASSSSSSRGYREQTPPSYHPRDPRDRERDYDRERDRERDRDSYYKRPRDDRDSYERHLRDYQYAEDKRRRL